MSYEGVAVGGRLFCGEVLLCPWAASVQFVCAFGDEHDGDGGCCQQFRQTQGKPNAGSPHGVGQQQEGRDQEYETAKQGQCRSRTYPLDALEIAYARNVDHVEHESGRKVRETVDGDACSRGVELDEQSGEHFGCEYESRGHHESAGDGRADGDAPCFPDAAPLAQTEVETYDGLCGLRDGVAHHEDERRVVPNDDVDDEPRRDELPNEDEDDELLPNLDDELRRELSMNDDEPLRRDVPLSNDELRRTVAEPLRRDDDVVLPTRLPYCLPAR